MEVLLSLKALSAIGMLISSFGSTGRLVVSHHVVRVRHEQLVTVPLSHNMTSLFAGVSKAVSNVNDKLAPGIIKAVSCIHTFLYMI